MTEHRNKAGQLHRKDGPAIEYPNGEQQWYINGQRHRTDGPAIEDSNGEQHWYINGQLHREDGPAIEYSNGKRWYVNGRRHREDGPAIEDLDGSKYWYVNGERHREDGPAIEYSDGSKHWYINGLLHSGTTTPVVLLKDDGRKYTLIYVDNLYLASCRRFNYSEAVSHWSDEAHKAPVSAALLLEAVKAHRARG